ncbi:hypothetical protein NLI96_g7988 [Meripilus lineatus]|uniref:Uncharacterized protein n=1 Tax=Meripilus lineatus TaxID=2056292 RepID=A0AAD5UY61_9APHY|nr:hypothetical protein NLI96_g7988 [Physisporinus lineatus]
MLSQPVAPPGTPPFLRYVPSLSLLLRHSSIIAIPVIENRIHLVVDDLRHQDFVSAELWIEELALNYEFRRTYQVELFPYHAFAPGWEEDVKKTAEMGSGYASDGPTNMGRARGDNRVENDNFDHEAIE